MLNEIVRSQAGQSKDVHVPRLIRNVIVDNLANYCTPFFSGIRQQLALGNLPDLAQHLDDVGPNLGENLILCSDKVTKVDI